MTSITTRFMEVEGGYTLVPFTIEEGSEVSFPTGSVPIHAEPLIEGESLAGFDLWVLVPADKVAEVSHEIGEHDG